MSDFSASAIALMRKTRSSSILLIIDTLLYEFEGKNCSYLKQFVAVPSSLVVCIII